MEEPLNSSNAGKPHRRFPLKRVSISVFLILLVALSVVVIVGQREDEYEIRVKELLKEALKLFRDIRGFSIDNVEVEVVNVEWVKENWGKAYAEADKENILRDEKVYKALFIISEDESLYMAEVEWWGIMVAAVWQDKIYVVEEYFNPSDKFNAQKTLVHELTHIMQGKRFSIPDMPTFDGGKAKAAMIEGDACLMEEAYVNITKTIGVVSQVMYVNPIINRYKGFLVSASLPDSIYRLNYFPYKYGLRFVKVLYSAGGWEVVNMAYENPPATTEQIMHPEKYFAGETYVETLAPVIPGEGWQKVKSERFGEYFILVMLERWVQSEAVEAAKGWNGDNFTYYERGEDYLFTWNITWDSQDDALQFVKAFQKMMRKTESEEVDANLWQAYGRLLSISWSDASTIIACSTSDADIREFLHKHGRTFQLPSESSQVET
ncbi:MAG: hypothetical protein QW717_03290 [Candidatus Bathyarchaeia archaeon]